MRTFVLSKLSKDFYKSSNGDLIFNYFNIASNDSLCALIVLSKSSFCEPLKQTTLQTVPAQDKFLASAFRENIFRKD